MEDGEFLSVSWEPMRDWHSVHDSGLAVACRADLTSAR